MVELIATLDAAGAERYVTELAARLDRRRFAVHAIALTRGGPLERDLDRAAVPHEVIGKRRKLDPAALARLAGRLRRLAPDVVHTHMFTANAYGRAAALLAAVPVVIGTEHNVDPWKTAAHALVDRALAEVTTRVVCVGADVRRACRRRGIPARRLVHIAQGIDAAAVVAAAGAGIEPAPWRVATACRLDPQKDVPTLVEAIAILRAGGRPATLEVAGDGPDRPRIEAAAARLDLAGAVRLLGWRDDVPRVIAGASAFALASRFEGLPRAPLEAMALGRPVVVSDAPGAREAVVPGESGLLARPGDPRSLAQALDAVLSDPARAAALGAAGRRRVAERYSLSAMVAAYERLFEEEVARVRARRSRRS